MDATSYVYCSELFPTPLRAQGAGFSVSGLFTATLIYTQTAPIAFAEVGWRFYILFIILPLLGALAMWKWFPETKLLSLEEIAALFGDEVAVDISHLNQEDRAHLDQRIRQEIGGETKNGLGIDENEAGNGEEKVHSDRLDKV